MCYQKIIRPLLFLLPAELSHNVTLFFLKYLGRFLKPKLIINNSVKLMGLDFPNRIGLAAGLDKNAIAIDAFATMGFGFIEVGTVTPRPQPGNKKPRLFRLTNHDALINRFGFNNVGIEQLIKNIKASNYRGILGINIGKNAITPLEQAVDDYLFCLEKAYPYADYITVNISSPNTTNLRTLQHGAELKKLLFNLKHCQLGLSKKHNYYVPLLVKIAPDLTTEAIKEIAELLISNEIDGVIATNTTSSRFAVSNELYAKEQGGLSGKPLYPLTLTVVEQLAKILRGKVPIIACGGISSAADAEAMLAAGADLLQIYTALIYQGPKLVRDITNLQFKNKDA